MEVHPITLLAVLQGSPSAQEHPSPPDPPPPPRCTTCTCSMRQWRYTQFRCLQHCRGHPQAHTLCPPPPPAIGTVTCTPGTLTPPSPFRHRNTLSPPLQPHPHAPHALAVCANGGTARFVTGGTAGVTRRHTHAVTHTALVATDCGPTIRWAGTVCTALLAVTAAAAAAAAAAGGLLVLDGLGR
jgi:hypothetical protein